MRELRKKLLDTLCGKGISNRTNRIFFLARTLVPIPFLSLTPGCAKTAEPEGYRVVSFDAATHQWLIIRNGTFDGKYLEKRITAVCSFYKSDNHEAITGAEKPKPTSKFS